MANRSYIERFDSGELDNRTLAHMLVRMYQRDGVPHQEASEHVAKILADHPEGRYRLPISSRISEGLQQYSPEERRQLDLELRADDLLGREDLLGGPPVVGSSAEIRRFLIAGLTEKGADLKDAQDVADKMLAETKGDPVAFGKRAREVLRERGLGDEDLGAVFSRMEEHRREEDRQQQVWEEQQRGAGGTSPGATKPGGPVETPAIGGEGTRPPLSFTPLLPSLDVTPHPAMDAGVAPSSAAGGAKSGTAEIDDSGAGVGGIPHPEQLPELSREGIVLGEHGVSFTGTDAPVGVQLARGSGLKNQRSTRR